jgi:hypothetical protein
LSFFTKSFRTRRGLSSVTDDEFLGYAILKEDHLPGTDKQVRVYESVIRQSQHPHNFIHGAQSWQCSVAGIGLRVNGYVYAQQNNVTNVCAHVAVRTAAARFHPQGDMSYREMNGLVGIDHVRRKAGGPDGEGLDTTEMMDLLESAGARCFVGDYTLPSGTPAVPFQKYLYGSIESGFPAIVVFEAAPPTAPGACDGQAQECHAVPAFGHTFNEDTWVPSAELSYFSVGSATRYIPSESWVSMYVVHDDNFGSNFCIPRQYLRPRTLCEHLAPEPGPCPFERQRVAYVIGTLPKSVRVNPIEAELVGVDYLFTILPQIPQDAVVWARRLQRYAQRNMLVVRPLLLERGDYVRHLEGVRGWSGSRIRPLLLEAFRKLLPDEALWMVELSVPELFSANLRKVAEVLIRAEKATGSRRDLKSFVLARLPRFFGLYDQGGPANPRYVFVPSGVDDHVELYRTEQRRS